MAWLPNALTILRLALAPVIFLCIVRLQYDVALVLLVVAGGSDWLDGVLARRFAWHSRLGSLLDPVADKLLFLALFVGLVLVELMPVWLAALAIGRDIVIIGGATLYNFTVERLTGSATWLGKLNTLIQGCYAFALLAVEAAGREAPQLIRGLSLLLLASIVVSGTHYVVAWGARARQRRHHD